MSLPSRFAKILYVFSQYIPNFIGNKKLFSEQAGYIMEESNYKSRSHLKMR